MVFTITPAFGEDTKEATGGSDAGVYVQPTSASLYVGDLNKNVSEYTLYEIFQDAGPVASIRVCRDKLTRASLGYAYVNYLTVSDAERAMKMFNYSPIEGRACRIMWKRRDSTTRKNADGNVFIKNLDKNIDTKALYDTFSVFGNILSCKVSLDENGHSLGYGFVNFEEHESAKSAMERVNGMEIGGKTVYVKTFQNREERHKSDGTNFTNMYVKNFPQDWDEGEVKQLFERIGCTTSVALRTDKKGRKFAFVNMEHPADAAKAIEEMHGKIDYRSEEEKERTRDKAPVPEEYYKFYCQRAQLKSERTKDLRQKFASTKLGALDGGKALETNLYVRNLVDTITDDGLKKLFAPFGAITSAKIMCDNQNRCRGFGFVCFSTAEEARKAMVEMNLKMVEGKALHVVFAEKKEDRKKRLEEQYYTAVNDEYARNDDGLRSNNGVWVPGSGTGGAMDLNLLRAMLPRTVVANTNYSGMRLPRPTGMPSHAPMMSSMGAAAAASVPQYVIPRAPMNLATGTSSSSQALAPPMHGGLPPLWPEEPLTMPMLASAAPGMKKQMLGEQLYPRIALLEPAAAGKVTGMMLEMDPEEVLKLLERQDLLKNKVDEAMKVLSALQ